MRARVVRLQDVVDINPTTKCAASDDDEVAFIAMADVSESGQLTRVQRRPLQDVKKGYTAFAVGDVLLAKITPCFENGKAALVDTLPTPIGFGSTEFHVLRPSEEVDGRFLFHLVWNPKLRRLGSLRMIGSAGQRRVPAAFLAEYEFQLPSLVEQRRIATILDKAHSLRRKRQEATSLVDEFLRAVFDDMFGDPLGGRSWSRTSIERLVQRIESGWSAPSVDFPLADAGIGVLKVSAVSTGWFLPDEAKSVDPRIIDRDLVTPKRGDLLFSRANTRELVAACCLVDEDVPNRFLPDKLWRITPHADTATSEYLCFLFRHPRFRHELTKQATGTSGSMLNISQAKLMQTVAPAPPIELQRRFSEIVWKTWAGRKRFDASRKELDALTASLAHRFFT